MLRAENIVHRGSSEGFLPMLEKQTSFTIQAFRSSTIGATDSKLWNIPGTLLEQLDHDKGWA